MPLSRARTAADVRHEIETTEQRLGELIARWRAQATTSALDASDSTREVLDRVEEILRFQRGAIDRLHQLWIEYAQAVGQHAPQ